MDAFTSGPFALTPGRALRVAGIPSRRWTMSYGASELAQHAVDDAASQAQVLDAFEVDRSLFIVQQREQHWPGRVDLVDSTTGDAVGSFRSDDMCGMTPGLIDDRSRYWLRSADRHYSRDVSLSEFATIAAAYSAPPAAWIAGLLGDEVLTRDPAEWRAPNSWELRHLVGEGSFTGITGAAAAELVGVTPQNFRKYTARDGASTRQSISFAMWHLLLHKLGVQRA